ncbi:MAG: hypothetical protein WBP82_09885 [Leuconostoc mesenteroides]
MTPNPYFFWFNNLSDEIKLVAWKLSPKTHYRIKSTSQICTILAFEQEESSAVTLTVHIIRGLNFGGFVENVNPTDLEIYRGDLN